MAATYVIYASPRPPLSQDLLPNLLVSAGGAPQHILYNYYHASQNRENLLMAPSTADDLCVAKTYPALKPGGHMFCEGSRNLAWKLKRTGIQNPIYKVTLPNPSASTKESPLFQLSKPSPTSPFWTLFYFAYAGHQVPPKRIEFGKVGRLPRERGGGTEVQIFGRTDEEAAVWLSLGEFNEDMVEWVVLCCVLAMKDDEIIREAASRGRTIGPYGPPLSQMFAAKRKFFSSADHAVPSLRADSSFAPKPKLAQIGVRGEAQTALPRPANLLPVEKKRGPIVLDGSPLPVELPPIPQEEPLDVQHAPALPDERSAPEQPEDSRFETSAEPRSLSRASHHRKSSLNLNKLFKRLKSEGTKSKISSNDRPVSDASPAPANPLYESDLGASVSGTNSSHEFSQVSPDSSELPSDNQAELTDKSHRSSTPDHAAPSPLAETASKESPRPVLASPGKNSPLPEPPLEEHVSSLDEDALDIRPQPSIFDPQPNIFHPQPSVYDNPQPDIYDNPQPGIYDNPQPGVYDNPQPSVYDNPQPGVYDNPQPSTYEHSHSNFPNNPQSSIFAPPPITTSQRAAPPRGPRKKPIPKNNTTLDSSCPSSRGSSAVISSNAASRDSSVQHTSDAAPLAQSHSPISRDENPLPEDPSDTDLFRYLAYGDTSENMGQTDSPNASLSYSRAISHEENRAPIYTMLLHGDGEDASSIIQHQDKSPSQTRPTVSSPILYGNAASSSRSQSVQSGLVNSSSNSSPQSVRLSPLQRRTQVYDYPDASPVHPMRLESSASVEVQGGLGSTGAEQLGSTGAEQEPESHPDSRNSILIQNSVLDKESIGSKNIEMWISESTFQHTGNQSNTSSEDDILNNEDSFEVHFPHDPIAQHLHTLSRRSNSNSSVGHEISPAKRLKNMDGSPNQTPQKRDTDPRVTLPPSVGSARSFVTASPGSSILKFGMLSCTDGESPLASSRISNMTIADASPKKSAQSAPMLLSSPSKGLDDDNECIVISKSSGKSSADDPYSEDWSSVNTSNSDTASFSRDVHSSFKHSDVSFLNGSSSGSPRSLLSGHPSSVFNSDTSSLSLSRNKGDDTTMTSFSVDDAKSEKGARGESRQIVHSNGGMLTKDKYLPHSKSGATGSVPWIKGSAMTPKQQMPPVASRLPGLKGSPSIGGSPHLHDTWSSVRMSPPQKDSGLVSDSLFDSGLSFDGWLSSRTGENPWE